MRTINLYNPKQLTFGPGCLEQMIKDYIASGKKRIFVISIESVLEKIRPNLQLLKENGISIITDTSVQSEPTFTDFERVIVIARGFKPDSVVGIGGGSVMDLAKIIAAFIEFKKPLNNFIGIGLLTERKTHLVCVPTTSGTGSEVSPNSILLDESTNSKKGIISPFLVPDAAYIDPDLTLDLPPAVTAFTGLDALTHCIEAFANKNAHPVTDILALDGIRLISGNLPVCFINGKDIKARTNLALGSMYGGMCLGPVNTGAVHALAYPLGSDYKIAHGLSNAVLLPFIMEFNLSEAEEQYAKIGSAMGLVNKSQRILAMEAIEKVKKLNSVCKIPARLRELGVKEENIESMAKSALEVQRLLKNNLRDVSLSDAVEIYQKAY